MLFAVTVRDLSEPGDPGPGDIHDVLDLILANRDEPGELLDALQRLRDQAGRGDWTTAVRIGGGAQPLLEIIPIRPADVAEHIAAINLVRG